MQAVLTSAALKNDMGAMTTQDDLIEEARDRRIGLFRYVWRILKAAIIALFLFMCVLLGGFLNFTVEVGWSQAPKSLKGDGMVVLTGGTKRVETALALLSEGTASRLLISGVAAQTSAADIADRYKAYTDLIDCCVDLDKGAENTIGNGTQTGRWIRENDFASVLVVTSAYHLPRAMVELTHSSSDTYFIGVPVVHSGLQLKYWYQDKDTALLMLREYAKYLATIARIAGKNAYVLFAQAVTG